MACHRPHPEDTALGRCGRMIDAPRQRLPRSKADEVNIDCRYCIEGMADPQTWDECIHEFVDEDGLSRERAS